jgi:hypothetical protein
MIVRKTYETVNGITEFEIKSRTDPD